MQEPLDLRMLLEPHAARGAAGCLTNDLVAGLREDLDAQRETAESAALDKRLDETARAHHIFPGLQDYMGAPDEQAGHELIYAAVAAGDPVDAEAAMRPHLSSIHAAMAG